MSSYITIILIGISLSMDAFSLSLAYGITGINQKDKLKLSLVVGIYHYIMPLIGFLISKTLVNIDIININIIAFLILLYVGIDLMIIKKEETVSINIIGFLLFGLSVSIDSLTVGLGLSAITSKLLLPPTVFSILSFSFTYVGLNIGTFIGKKIKKTSQIVGGIILIIIAFLILVK